MKYYETFGQSGFHSAFMTTYAFGGQAFEDIPFPRLRGAGCRNIVVMVDKTMANQNFAEFGPPRFAGSSYHLVPVSAPMAFHSKIVMLLGAKKGRLMVGSANLTALGLGGNKELVSSISFDNETPDTAHFFAEALQYIRRYLPVDFPGFDMSLGRALKNTPWLREALDDATAIPTPGISFLYDREDVTIFDQILQLIGNDKIRRLIVLSPYWDQQLEALSRLSQALGKPEVHLLIEPDCGFPVGALRRAPNTSLYNLANLDDGKFLGSRFSHAKLIIAEGRSWDHVISGSMNCTSAALLSRSFQFGNAEAGLYQRISPGEACKRLGLTGYADNPLNVDGVLPQEKPISESEKDDHYPDAGRLVLIDQRLTWRPPELQSAAVAEVRLFDREGHPIEGERRVSSPGIRSWLLPADLPRPRHGEIHFETGTVSVPLPIIDLNTLAISTLPPHKGPKRNLLLALAEAVDADLELIEIMNALEAMDEGDITEHHERLARAAGERSKELDRIEGRVLSYDEFVNARSTASLYAAHPAGFSPSKGAGSYIADSLNRLIGLVSEDLEAAEDDDLLRISQMTFESTEPIDADNVGTGDPSKPAQFDEVPPLPSQSLATAKKLQEAVSAFERRCKSLADGPITTAELVRVRLLLQIILSHSQGPTKPPATIEVLPCYTAEGHDWPRLVGRVLKAYFLLNATQRLLVQANETEQHRLLECAAFGSWAGTRAAELAASYPPALPLKKALALIHERMEAEAIAIITAMPEDEAYYTDVKTKCAGRFAHLT